MPEMRVPLKWLKEYVDITVPLTELADRMTLAGLEVNEIHEFGSEWDPEKVVVGQIIEVNPHPNADSLVLATVNHGADEPQTVVTGAPNVRVGESGMKIVFARRGARLVDAYADTHQYKVLKPAKIRGVRSEGMVCSERELDISDEHEGILVLPDDAPVGMPLRKYLGDQVLEIEIIPNIARCLSIVGVAREVAVLTGQELKLPPLEWTAEGPAAEGRVEIEIADTDLCSRYSGGIIEGTQIAPSPLWLKARLLAAGQRPISNVVDITNYVMFEWGQPLHAFDLDTLRGREGRTPPDEAPIIIVRRASEGEEMTTLDGAERTLDPEMLLITDGGGPVALAGVMGGLETEVTDSTTRILLEAANFNYINNRRTSALLNLPSEAATRFGRGIDPELTVRGLMAAAEMMRALAGGTIAKGIVDCYPVVPVPTVIEFPTSEVARLAGVSPSTDQIVSILESLGFTCDEIDDEGVLSVTVPSHRLDVSLKADLVEEVARIYGSENIPLTLLEEELPPQANNIKLSNREHVRDVLVSAGLAEIITYSLIGVEDQAKLLAAYGEEKPFQAVLGPGAEYPVPAILAAEDCFALANPQTPDQAIMRTTLLSRMLTTVRDNLRYQQRLALFEVSNIYLPRTGQLLADEPERLCIAMTGARMAPWWSGEGDAGEIDFFDLKGVVETLAAKSDVNDVAYEPSDSPLFQPGRAASIRVGDAVVGLMGEVHPQVREAFGLPDQRICLLELDLPKMLGARSGYVQHKPISRYPLVTQDLALVVGKGVPARAVEEAILASGGESIAAVRLFDIYEGEPIPPDKRSLAYSISFQDQRRTLTDKAVRRIREKIRIHLEREIGAQVRS